MRCVILLLSCLLCAWPARAADDCPPGHVRHDAISPLDDAYMLSAFKASFRGIHGREPTMVDKSGIDDGWYYIRQSNHFGVYGDDQCHAGWSRYWESWIRIGQGDLEGVQLPARFLPGVTPDPPKPPDPPPPPVNVPPVNVQALADQLRSTYLALKDQADVLHAAEIDAIALVRQDVADFREAVRSKVAAILKSPYFQVITGALVTWATTYKTIR